MKNMLVMSAVAGLSAFGALADGDEPVTGVFNGGDFNLYTPYVWDINAVPARMAKTLEDGTVVTNGAWGSTMVFDGAKDGTWADRFYLGSIVSVGNIIFQGANLLQHYFCNYQVVRLEAGGLFWVKEDADKVPYFDGSATLSAYNTSAGNSTITIRNDSPAGALKLAQIGNLKGMRAPGYVGTNTIRIEGKGGGLEITHSVWEDSGAYIFILAQENESAMTYFNTETREFRFYQILVPAGVPKQTLKLGAGEVAKSCMLGGADARPFVAESDVDVLGPGTVYFGAGLNDSSTIEVKPGATVNWSAGIKNNSNDGGYSTLEFRVLGGGTFILAAGTKNIILGNAEVLDGTTLMAPGIGVSGTASELGAGSTVTVQGGSTLVYTGAGETSDRTVAFGAGGGTLDHRGTGALTTGPVTVVADATLVATNGQAIVLSSLTRTAGLVNVIAANGGSVSLSGQAAGPAPQWLQFNGGIARFGAGGVIMGIDGPSDYEIDAHGGQIPNDANAKVGIVSASAETESGITLAESPAAVNILSQEQAEEPAVVTVGAGQELAPSVVNIASGAAPLVVTGAGEFGGEMLLVGGELVRSNAMTGASIALTATDGPAGITLDGAVSEDSPVYLKAREGRVSVRGTGAVPVRELGVNGGEVAYGKLDAYEPGVVANFDSITHQPSLALSVGTASTGILSFDGGTFTGKVTIGQGTAGMGALYQMGGQIVNWQSYKNAEGTSTTHNNPFGYGSGAYAYLGIEGGTYRQTGNAWISGDNGETVIDLLGNGRFAWARTYDRNYTAFGAWNTLLAIHVGDNAVYDGSNSSDSESITMPFFNRQDTQVEITVDGEGLMDLGNCEINLAGHAQSNSDYRHYMFNLNGGVLHARRIIRYASETQPSDEFPEGTGGADRANSYGFVNANGGVFKANADVSLFGTRTDGGAYPIDRVTLFEKGLTIDTNGKNPEIGLGGGLRAPSGKGVASIPWNAAADGKGFIGAPIVIIDGDGKGASARAVFDRATRTVTGIVVTSHGNDYTTASARISYGRKTVKTIPCELADNVSGGFTKIGAGTLAVNGTNTYTGATVVKAGTVKLGVDDAFSSASALVLDGGTLDLDGRHQAFSDVSFANGGKVQNGTVDVSGLAVDFNDALAKKVKTVDMASVAFAPGAAVTVANFDATKLDEAVRRYVLVTFQNGVPDPALVLPTLDLPEGWSFKMSGNKLRIAKDTGLMLLVR